MNKVFENKNLIEVKELNFRYDNSPSLILKNVSFTIKDKTIVTLLGANGSGKSTIFNLLTKNLKAKSSSIKLMNKDINNIKLKELSKLISVVHQDNTYPSDFTVYDYISFGRNPHQGFFTRLSNEDEEKICFAMKVTDTLKIKDKKVSNLSGGQRQRVYIAMALAQDTKILLLDEPTTFLDIRYQLEILNLIKRLNEEYNITVLMVLHDINQAIKYSDEIILLKDGEIIGSGNPRDCLDEVQLQKLYSTKLKIINENDQRFVLTC